MLVCSIRLFFTLGSEDKTRCYGILFVILLGFSPPGFSIHLFKHWSFLLVAGRTNQLNCTQEVTLVYAHNGEKNLCKIM